MKKKRKKERKNKTNNQESIWAYLDFIMLVRAIYDPLMGQGEKSNILVNNGFVYSVVYPMKHHHRKTSLFIFNMSLM